MKTKEKKPIFKKWWFWLIIIIVLVSIGTAGGNKSQTTQTTSTSSTTKTQQSSSTPQKDKLTLNDGWSLDTSNPYAAKVVGSVSNNSDQAINGYIQITFSALDESGANVGDCLANANTVDAKGTWKFEAICSGSNIKTVRFKELTGF